MIAEVLEIIGSGALGSFITALPFIIKSKVLRPLNIKYVPDSLGALPWTYRRMSNGNNGFYCPKCINMHSNTKQMPACSCEDYPRVHFHFECGDCGFKSLMRSADDP